jgi:hypothetical protein
MLWLVRRTSWFGCCWVLLETLKREATMKKDSTKSSADNSFMKVHPRGSLAALLAALAFES